MELDPVVGAGGDPTRRRKVTIHASQLAPYEKPYIEPEDLDVGLEAEPEGYPDEDSP